MFPSALSPFGSAPSEATAPTRFGALRRSAILAIAVAAATSIGLVSVPAAQSNSGAPVPASTHHSARPVVSSQADVGTYYGSQVSVNGYNWSGVVIPRGSFHSVSSSWTEPKVSCRHKRDLMAPWVGIDGQNNNAVEQTGVETSCASGTARYQAWYEVYPAPAHYYANTVKAGDKITATVTRRGSSYTMTLTNHTRHWTRTTKRVHHTGHSSAEVVLESPSSAYPTYRKISFSNTSVNGHTLSHFSLYRMRATSKHGTQNYTSRVSSGHFSISYRKE